MALGCASCSADSPARAAADDGGTAAAVSTPPKVGDAGAKADATSTVAPPSAPTTYLNPVFPLDFPDPFVLRDGARYYAFATNGAGKNIQIATSEDLRNWAPLPDALPTLPSWAKANASLTWAPSILVRGKTFVLYYAARDVASGFQCIGRAIAATPAGPYVDDTAAPFICQTAPPEALCGSIDPSPFVDENGDPYLLWKSDENAAPCSGAARIWTQRLGIDGISLLGDAKELLQRSEDWESPLIEGPSMLKYRDTYFLFYSASWWESSSYGIGYAVCATPTGPCVKKTTDGPLVASTGDVLGPGGQELFTDTDGKLWMAYHGWSSPVVGYDNGGARSLRIDPLQFANGVPSLAGPTTTASPL